MRLKIFTIFVVVCFLIASAGMSHYSVVCMTHGFDYAIFTVYGVLCIADIPHLKYPHMFLRDVIERENTPKNQNPLQSDPLPDKDI